jgi:hypothetical protein
MRQVTETRAVDYLLLPGVVARTVTQGRCRTRRPGNIGCQDGTRRPRVH